MKRTIGAVLKAAAKTNGLTQAEVAKLMKVSLPTVKRWFSGRGLELDRLEALLKLLGLSFKELADSVSFQEAKEFEFTLEQETAFASDPTLLAYFHQLLSGNSPKKVSKIFRLSERQNIRFLRSLEGLKVIERRPGDKVKILAVGQPRWRLNGPLAKKLKKKAIQDFLSQVSLNVTRLGLHKINSDDLQRLNTMLIEIQTFARSAENRAHVYPDQPVSIGLLVGCAPFSWSFLNPV